MVRLVILVTLVCMSIVGLISKRHYDKSRAEREELDALHAADSLPTPKSRDDSLEVFVMDLLDYLKDEPVKQQDK